MDLITVIILIIAAGTGSAYCALPKYRAAA